MYTSRKKESRAHFIFALDRFSSHFFRGDEKPKPCVNSNLHTVLPLTSSARVQRKLIYLSISAQLHSLAQSGMDSPFIICVKTRTQAHPNNN